MCYLFAGPGGRVEDNILGLDFASHKCQIKIKEGDVNANRDGP
jgi:hypothetical protein